MGKHTLLIVLFLGCAVSAAPARTPGEGAHATPAGRRRMRQRELVRRLSQRGTSADPPPGGPTTAAAVPGASARGPCIPDLNLSEPEMLVAYLAPRRAGADNVNSCGAGQQPFNPSRRIQAGDEVQPALDAAAGGPPIAEAMGARAGREANAAGRTGGSEAVVATGTSAGAPEPGMVEAAPAAGATTGADPKAPSGSTDSTSPADPTAPADPAAPASATPAEPSGGASPESSHPAPWIWQGSDQAPVRAGGGIPRSRALVNPLSESGFVLNLSGNANVGYSSQAQNQSPGYTDFDGGLGLNASGFIYNPQLVSYRIWGAYDRRDSGYGSLNAGGDSYNYGGTFSFLQATPAPFTVSWMRDSDKFGGTLSMPFNFDSQSVAVDGSVHRLPVGVTYHLADGETSAVTADGHNFDYRYVNGDLAINKKAGGFDFHLVDDYLHVFSKQTLTETPGESGTIELADVGQTDNTLRVNVERSFGTRVTMHVDGNVSKYVFDNANLQSTHSTLASFGAGVLWNIRDDLSASFSGLISHNGVNILQLLSLSTGVSLPNPLPGVAVLNSDSQLFTSMVSYRPSRHWTFGAASSYNSAGFPALTEATVPVNEQGLTNRILSNDVSAAFNHHVWKFDYFAAASGGIQNYSYTSGQGGMVKLYNASSGITGGDEGSLHYSARFTIDRTDNPVFFSLLNTRDRIFDLDLARRERFVRLNGTASYSQREILYAGSVQHLNAFNFMLAANLSSVNITASHYTSDTNQQFFGILSPIAGGAGSTPLPPGLLLPLVFARNKSDAAAISWRALKNLQFDSRYTRFGFTIIGTDQSDQETWFDNSIQYHLGRFDIIGGYVRATGLTPSFDRRVDRVYFRIRFPFQIW